ncbi:MAG: CrcB family protein [Phycisphaeraceae bacterium]
MWKLVLLAMGGAMGAVLRVEAVRLIDGLFQHRVAWLPMNLGLLAVNLSGCLAFGVAWAVLDARGQLHSAWAWALLGGGLGAFTTFSTFAFESTQLFEKAGGWWAVAQLIGHNAVGIALIFVGLAAGRAMTGIGG